MILVFDNLNTHKRASLYERSSQARTTPGDTLHAEARQLVEHRRDRTEPHAIIIWEIPYCCVLNDIVYILNPGAPQLTLRSRYKRFSSS